MNEKESKLEEISDKVNNYNPTKHLPIFELYISVFSVLMAAMLFLFPEMLQPSVDIGSKSLYWLLLSIMPQPFWAFTFFIAGVTKSIGLLIDNNITRIVGLVISVLIYAVFAVMYSFSFPAIGMVVFSVMMLFTIISIPMVKSTGIKY